MLDRAASTRTRAVLLHGEDFEQSTDLRGNVALEGCSEAVAKALLDTRKSRKPAVEELWFPINDQQEGSGAVDLVQQLEYAEVMGHDEL